MKNSATRTAVTGSVAVINGRILLLPEESLEKSLMEFLREDLDLTGTKNGCNIGVCGACTVLLDGQAESACRLKVKDIASHELLTIEGLHGPDGSLHPLQRAFMDYGAIQCGFCTPGMVLAAHAFLLKHPRPTRDRIRKAIQPNLCRCTGYQQIVDAIEAAAPYYQDPKSHD
jgi:aerobic-type carbon monoxide dehydrogenase small subunit (CoxS/CutS family)